MKCTQPQSDEYYDLLKFANKVFHVNFLKLMPKLYNDPNYCISVHGVCKEENTIIGCICVNPSKFIIGDEALIAVGIGSVAVHKKHRGKGVMGALMKFSNERALSIGANIGFLAGARGRYEHFGYVPCGIDYSFEISHYCIAHNKPTKGYTFENLANSPNLIEEIIKIYELNPNRWERKTDKFSDILYTHKNLTFAVKDDQGNVFGFITTNRTASNIQDIYLIDENKIVDVLLGFAKHKHRTSFSVHLYDFQRESIKKLLSFAEYYLVNTTMSIKIFDFKETIEKMMKYKLSFSSLPEGELRLKIDDEILLICVKGKNVSVEITNGDFDLEMTKLQATLALCTFHGGLYENDLMSAWSPICPISMSHTDNV